MKIENFSRLFPEIKICSGALFKDERGFFSKNLFSTELKTLMPNMFLIMSILKETGNFLMKAKRKNC